MYRRLLVLTPQLFDPKKDRYDRRLCAIDNSYGHEVLDALG